MHALTVCCCRCSAAACSIALLQVEGKRAGRTGLRLSVWFAVHKRPAAGAASHRRYCRLAVTGPASNEKNQWLLQWRAGSVTAQCGAWQKQCLWAAQVTPELSLRPNEGSWNQRYGLLYIDQPVGTGFSTLGARPLLQTHAQRAAQHSTLPSPAEPRRPGLPST